MLKIIPQPRFIEYKEGLSKNKIDYVMDKTISQEGYILDASAEGITLRHSTPEGKFYGEKTIEQILRQSQFGIPQMVIKDSPRYAYRGFMMDCSRHFFDMETIKKYIDIISGLKINKFHWHLTDDQGWRIEIKKYPLLTQTGSYRKSTRKDNKPVSGFYTQEEIREIVNYCAERYIEVIPEIDMPGHFTSAIASYSFLGCENKIIPVSESFGIHADIACAGKETTYEFCENVLEEVFQLFPSELIHLGGDEALKLKWIKCPHCQKKITDNNLKNEEELQGYFMNRLIDFANSRGKKVINWNDGLCGGNISEVIMQYWKESKIGKEVLYKEIEKGRKVIMSPFFAYYMDYPYGMTSLKKTYNYEMRENINDAVLGLEAPIWTEYVEDAKKMDYMVFPRLIAVAERAWNEENNYDTFLERLEEFNNYLDIYEINYAKNYNPRKIKAAGQVIRFFSNAYDSTLRKNLKLLTLDRKARKKKYGKK